MSATLLLAAVVLTQVYDSPQSAHAATQRAAARLNGGPEPVVELPPGWTEKDVEALERRLRAQLGRLPTTVRRKAVEAHTALTKAPPRVSGLLARRFWEARTLESAIAKAQGR